MESIIEVRNAFAEQAPHAFAFLAGGFGMSGPKRQEAMVAFDGHGLRYRVVLDAGHDTVMTYVETVLGDQRLVAELPALVEAAGAGSREHIATGAATVSGLLHSMDSQSAYTRRLHRRLVSGDLVELMRAAGADERTIPPADYRELDALVRAVYEQMQSQFSADIADEMRSVVAVPEEIVHAERELGVVLPDSYKHFMLTHGASFFLGEETIPVVHPDPDHFSGLVEYNRSLDFDEPFVAVVTLGTGDYLGFVHDDGVCKEPVYLWLHDDEDLKQVAPDFAEWAADRARQKLESP